MEQHEFGGLEQRVRSPAIYEYKMGQRADKLLGYRCSKPEWVLLFLPVRWIRPSGYYILYEFDCVQLSFALSTTPGSSVEK
jgi:hypothetical protein